MDRFSRAYVAAIEAICFTGITGVLFIGILQVYYRYVVESSLSWSEELMRYIMLWVVAFGAGLAFTRGQFLGMRLLIEKAPAGLRRAIDFISALLMLLFLAVIIWYGFIFSWGTRLQSATSVPISLFWVHISIVVCAVLLAAHIFVKEILGINEDAHHDPHDMGAEEAL